MYRKIFAVLYWLFAALPLLAAFLVFRALPLYVPLMPDVYAPSGRAGVWLLPLVNLLFAVLLHSGLERECRKWSARTEHIGGRSDAERTFPAIGLFGMVFLSALTLCVVYSFFIFDDGTRVFALIGRVAAFLSGIGTALFALKMPRATKHSVLALRFSYTMKNSQVWLKTHKMGTPLLYGTGAVMMLSGVAQEGFAALITAGFALLIGLIGLYLYAKRLYDDEALR